jgi:uncharacterized CHY-type Zn-finger protein
MTLGPPLARPKPVKCGDCGREFDVGETAHWCPYCMDHFCMKCAQQKHTHAEAGFPG